MKLRTFLAISSGFVALLSLTAAGMLIVLAGDHRSSAAYLLTSMRSVHVAQQIRIEVAALAAEGAGSKRHAHAAEAALAQAAGWVQSEEEAGVLARVRGEIGALRVAALHARSVADEALLAAAQRADAAARELVDVNIRQASTADEAIARRMNQGARLALVVAAALVLGVGLVVVWIHAWLLRPLWALREQIRGVALGRRVPLVGAGGPRELRDVLETFGVLVAALDERRTERLESLRTIALQVAAPLDSMASTTAALGRRAGGGGHPGEPRFAELGQRGARLHRMLSEYLEMERIEEGDLDLRFDRFDLLELATESADVFRPVAAGYSIDLLLPEQPLEVEGDRTRISQALNALLSAAVRRPPAAGRVELRVKPEGASCSLSLSVLYDHPVPFEGLFNSLHGLDRSVLLIPGSMLSVRACRRIVEAHGGGLDIEVAGDRRVDMVIKLPTRAGVASRVCGAAVPLVVVERS